MEIFDFPGDLRRSIASRKSYDREDEGSMEVLGEAGRVAEGLMKACPFCASQRESKCWIRIQNFQWWKFCLHWLSDGLEPVTSEVYSIDMSRIHVAGSCAERCWARSSRTHLKWNFWSFWFGVTRPKTGHCCPSAAWRMSSKIANKQVSHSIAWQSHRNNLYLLACGDGFGIEDMNGSLRQLHGVNDLSCFISGVNL